MDREYHVLGRGELQGDATETNLQIKVLDGAAGRVTQAEVVQAVPPDSTMPVIMGRVILRKSSLVVLEPMRKLGSAVRKHFRMPVSFESFVYLRTGGRALFRSIDLSCGGMAFYTAAPLDVGDDPEVVIPITSEGPLILTAEVLRWKAVGPLRQCASRFVNIIQDQETMLQEAVFNAQMLSIRTANRQKQNA